MMRLIHTVTVTLAILVFAQNSFGQNGQKELALAEMQRVTEKYQSTKGDFQFEVHNSHRYACTDSIIQEQKLDYTVRNENYFIQSGGIDMVLTKKFFLMINHDEKYIMISDNPSLDYLDMTNQKRMEELRKILLENNEVYVTDVDNKRKKIEVKFTSESGGRYERMEFIYSRDYQFESMTYFERLPQTPLIIKSPDCVRVEYKGSKELKASKDLFTIEKYLIKTKTGYQTTSDYQAYQIIEQKEPNE